MAIPAYGGASAAKAEGTTTISPGIPSGVATGDLMLACIVYGNTGTVTCTTQAGGAWAQTTTGTVEVGATTTFAGSVIFYDYYNGSQTAPTFTCGSGNHIMGRIIYITGARSADGASFAGNTEGSDSSGDANMSIATGMTTTDADCLIVSNFALADDSPTFGATFTNANLASITNRITDTTTQGNDSSQSVVTGTLAVAGAVGTWTNTLGGALNAAATFLAIRPPAAGGAAWTGIHTEDRSIYTAV